MLILSERKQNLEVVREIISNIIKHIKRIDYFKDIKTKLGDIKDDLSNDWEVTKKHLEQVVQCQNIYRDAILEGLQEVQRISSEGNSSESAEVFSSINKRLQESWTQLSFYLKDSFSGFGEVISEIRNNISANGNQL